MTRCDDFYIRRDQRTAFYLDGREVLPRPLQVSWGDEVAYSSTGQFLLLAHANMLARFCRCASFSGPDAPLLVPTPLGGTSLRDAVLTACYAIDPCGAWQTKPISGAAYHLGIGRDAADGADIYLGADGWIAHAVARSGSLPISSSTDGILGAGLAACIGAANAFKASLSLRQPFAQGVVSLWSLGRDEHAEQGPPPPSVDLGDVLMVGAGAVASALVYWLHFLPVRGRWDIVDRDIVTLDNTNRGMLFTAADAGWPTETGKPKTSVLAAQLPNAMPHIEWFHELDAAPGKRWDILLPLANEYSVRAALQASLPPLMMHATTSRDWYTQLHRHRPGQDECLTCRLPESDLPPPACAAAPLGGVVPQLEERPPDAALPFLSAGAGLLLAADLVRVGLGGYASQEGNLLTIDWWGDLGRPTIRQQSCRAGCVAWGAQITRKVLNGRTRWYAVDSAAEEAAS